ncbi:MAG: thymidine kinase [Bacteriovoracales bacterium]|nr:thymidine kinase [Bacteriovoracales bacterium]
MGIYRAGHGSLEVICGPMFSGKTTELIRRVARAQIAKQRAQVFKPSIDSRYDSEKVVGHDSGCLKATPLDRPTEIFRHLYDNTRLVAIDEVQFFDNDIVVVVNKLACRGYRVVCAGLDLDYRGIPFGPLPGLLSIADEVSKIHAICTLCGAEASRTQRIVDSGDAVLLGEKEAYEARCRAHFEYFNEEEMLPLNEEIKADWEAHPG